MATTPINEVIPFAQYVASAAADTFAFTWWIRDAEDLKVYVNGVLVGTADYSVTGVKNPVGGSVVLDTPLSGGQIVTISTDYPFQRLTGFATSGSLRAEALNLELSYLVACVLQLQRDAQRSLKLAVASQTNPALLVLPEPFSGKVLVWDGDLGQIKNSTVSVGDLDAALATASAAAVTATTQAGIATTGATAATTQAGIATTGATTATTQAGIATTGATTATTKAAEAATSAANAAATAAPATALIQKVDTLSSSIGQAPIHALFNNTTPVAATVTLSGGYAAPYLLSNGRLVQSKTDGTLDLVPTNAESDVRYLTQLAAPIGFLVGNEAPFYATTDINGYVIEAVTATGRIFVMSPTGLVEKAGVDTPKYEVKTYTAGDPSTVSANSDTNICYILPTIGQSNALGQNAVAGDALVASASQYASALMLGGVGWDFNAAGPRRVDQTTMSTALLVEYKGGSQQETAASGWANHLIRDVAAGIGRNIRTLSFVAAIGGKNYIELKQGTLAYSYFLASLQSAVSICRKNGWTPIVPAIDWCQGENDTNTAYTPTKLQRIAQIRQLARNLTDDIKAMTGQSETPFLAITQTARTTNDPWYNEVRDADVELDGQDNIRVVGPMYQYPSADTVHISNAGQNGRGQAIARAVVEEYFGRGWVPVKCFDHRWVSSTVLELDFSMQTSPLVIDTSDAVISTSGLGSSYGFNFDDRSGSSPVISSVAVVSNTKVRLTLSGATTGRQGRINYATKRNSGNTTQDGPITGARGCLRDSTSHANLYGLNNQSNWALAFTREVGGP